MEKRVSSWYFHKQNFCHLFQGPRGSRGTTGPSGYPGQPGLPVRSHCGYTTLHFQDMHKFWCTNFSTCLNMNQSLEIIFEADGREIFALPYDFGSSGIGALLWFGWTGHWNVVLSHTCMNMFHPGSLWSWRNAASALSLFPFLKATLWETGKWEARVQPLWKQWLVALWDRYIPRGNSASRCCWQEEVIFKAKLCLNQTY